MTLTHLIAFTAGLLLLYYGAGWLVKGSSLLARELGLESKEVLARAGEMADRLLGFKDLFLVGFKDLFLVGFFLSIGLSGAPSLEGLGIAALLRPEEALVVIVDGDGEDLLRVVLGDHVLVETMVDLARRHELRSCAKRVTDSKTQIGAQRAIGQTLI